VEQLHRDNKAVLAFCEKKGGHRIQTIATTPHISRWLATAFWSEMEQEAKYDPQAILSPGQRMFSSLAEAASSAVS